MTDIAGVLAVYSGLAAAAAGAISIVWPMYFLGIRDRKRALAVLAAGFGLVVVGASLPAPLRRSANERSRIDDFMPEYHFNEFHAVRVHATPERIFSAIKEVPASDIRFFLLLTWIRSPRLRGSTAEESILNPAAEKPILDVATSTSFLTLAEEPPRVMVLGTVLNDRRPDTPQAFMALVKPGSTKAVMDFAVTPQPDGSCKVTTETRILTSDAAALRSFSLYWRLIYPGSALIRRMWLGAIKVRAER